MDTNITMIERFNSIQSSIMKTLKSGYYHLGILPITTELHEEEFAKQIAESCDGNILNVALLLSEELMDISSSQRAVHAPSELQSLLPTAPYVVLYHLSILFHPELQLNVFRFLLEMSRNTPIIALLSCQYDEHWLWYAEPGHPEYQRYAREELYLIPIDEK